MNEIRIKIAKGGKAVKIDVNGVTGTACKDLTKAIEGALGTVAEVEDKPELYQTGSTDAYQSQGGGA